MSKARTRWYLHLNFDGVVVKKRKKSSPLVTVDTELWWRGQLGRRRKMPNLLTSCYHGSKTRNDKTDHHQGKRWTEKGFQWEDAPPDTATLSGEIQQTWGKRGHLQPVTEIPSVLQKHSQYSNFFPPWHTKTNREEGKSVFWSSSAGLRCQGLSFYVGLRHGKTGKGLLQKQIPIGLDRPGSAVSLHLPLSNPGVGLKEQPHDNNKNKNISAVSSCQLISIVFLSSKHI